MNLETSNREFRRPRIGFRTRYRFAFQMCGLLGIMLVSAHYAKVFVTIRAGHEGVMFRRFSGGTQLHKVWTEGFHVLPSWDRLAIYDMRRQQETFEMPALSSNGVRVVVEASVRYHPISETLPKLHKFVGPDYFEKIVEPEVRSVLRERIGDCSPEALYTSQGHVLERVLADAIRETEWRWVRVDDLLITRVDLPEIVRTAIELKAKQEQLALEYQWRVEREWREVERKTLEATGIKNFQDTVIAGVSEDYLRWRGLEATLSLAASQNSKLVIIGNRPSGGLPVVLSATAPKATQGSKP